MRPEILFALVYFNFTNLFAIHKDIPNSEYYDYTAQEKQDYIYNKLVQYEYAIMPDLGNKIECFLKLSPDKVGILAKIKFIVLSKEYSGIYNSGSIGYIKFSLSADLNPRLDIKFLIDDSESINISFLGKSQNCESDCDLFIQYFVSNSKHVPLRDLAMRSKNGRLEFDVKVPKELILVPSQKLELIIRQNYKKDFRVALQAVPKEALLYEVWARSNSQEEASHIANIILDSEFIASEYGDEMLFQPETCSLVKYFYCRLQELYIE